MSATLRVAARQEGHARGVVQIAENVLLAPLTTIGIGGPARFFFRATTVDEIREAMEWARVRDIPLFLLGGGSNLLIADEGFPGVTFRLKRGGEAAIRYPELKKIVEERGIANDDLPGVREAVIAIRKRKGMVLDPNDPDTRSDGSFFMNPVLTAEQFAKFPHPVGPHFPSGDDVKLSAAWLIEHAGFHKGYIHGNVGLSSKHTLAIINRGGGTAREVVELVSMIQAKVREEFGVELHPEPNFIGF